MKVSFLSALFLVGSVAATALGQVETAVSAADPLAIQRENERYRIGFQDTLEVQIFRHADLTQRVRVNPNGTINLFRLPDPIVAVCKTERELAKEIAAAYEKDYLRNPEVNVVAVEQRSQAYAVLGAVDKPGYYFINRPIRLLELLAQAGGHTDKAGSRIVVARTGSTSNCKLHEPQAAEAADFTVMDFKLKDVLEAKQNFAMRPGDIISVLDADVVYVYGNVEKQGQVEMKEPMTLTQAIASAEGLKAATKKSDIRILRQKAGAAEREEFVFDLEDIDKRRVADPYLEPNDIVAVGKDSTKSILNSLGRSLTNGIPSLFYRVP